MASVVGGGDLHRLSSVQIRLVFARPSTKEFVGDEDRCRRPPDRSPLSSLGDPSVLPSRFDHPIRDSSPALWSPESFLLLCFSPAATTPEGFNPCSGVLDSKGFWAVCRLFKMRVCGWVFWFGREVREVLMKIVGVLVVFPELDPVVYCLSGVGSSFIVLFVIWAAGVGSGWLISVFYASTVLLIGYSQYSVVVNSERYGMSMDKDLYPTPKGVYPYGVFKCSQY